MNQFVHNEKHCSLVARFILILMQLPNLCGCRIVDSPFPSIKKKFNFNSSTLILSLYKAPCLQRSENLSYKNTGLF